MPSTDLSGFGKAMFEKRMRERNMGQDPFGNFKGPMPPSAPPVRFRTREDILDEAMRLQKDAPPGTFADRILGDGFDNSALMQDPKFKQEDTMNQGMAVSEPYEEANEKAFGKNNPMNAISQETPVVDKVSEFLRRIGGGSADFMTGGMTDFDGRGR